MSFARSLQEDGREVFAAIAAGAWEVGQAYRLMLTLFFVSIICLNSGLDFLHLVAACSLGVVSFSLAEAALFLSSDSAGRRAALGATRPCSFCSCCSCCSCHGRHQAL